MRLNIQTVEYGKPVREPAGVAAEHSWSDLLLPIRQSLSRAYAEDGSGALPESEAIFVALAQAVEQRDRHTAGHCERLAFISVALGVVTGLDRADLLTLYRGGYMHDIGKVGIPDSILFKPAKLDEREWEVMRTHTIRGVEICRHLTSLSAVVPIIRHHHERWDGSGYPDGLRGPEIPLLARLLQIADIYDALTSARPYKDAVSPEQALRVIREETARGWRDPDVVETFLELHRDVISKADQFVAGSDRSLHAMRAALTRLQLPS
jgi:putative two-component system response regulator